MDTFSKHDTAIRLYLDATNTIRHYDGERMSTNRIAIAVVGSLLALISSDAFGDNSMTVPLSGLGLLLCVTFFYISKKYNDLILRERSKARAASAEMQTLGDDVVILVDENKRKHYEKSRENLPSLQSMWSFFYFLLAISFAYLIIQKML